MQDNNLSDAEKAFIDGVIPECCKPVIPVMFGDAQVGTAIIHSTGGEGFKDIYAQMFLDRQKMSPEQKLMHKIELNSNLPILPANHYTFYDVPTSELIKEDGKKCMESLNERLRKSLMIPADRFNDSNDSESVEYSSINAKNRMNLMLAKLLKIPADRFNAPKLTLNQAESWQTFQDDLANRAKQRMVSYRRDWVKPIIRTNRFFKKLKIKVGSVYFDGYRLIKITSIKKYHVNYAYYVDSDGVRFFGKRSEYAKSLKNVKV